MANYYKVTCQSMYSVFSHKYSIRYELNKWIEPTLKSSLLFVFDNLEAARKFARLNYGRIFRCEIEPANKIRERILKLVDLEYDSAPEYWNINENLCDSLGGRTNPTIAGTVFAKMVKLIEEIKI